MSLINIIFSQDGSDIKDDVVRRIKEGPDRLSNIKVCSLNDRFLGVNSDHNAEVNVLIITPSMCSKISKHGDEDFKTVFPNVQKSLLLICDANSEQKVCSVISRSVNYSEIRQFHISNAMEWRYMLVPTIKAMASSDKEELHIPGINRYVIKPKQVDSCVEEVCVVFLDAIDQRQTVEVVIEDKLIITKQISRGVYVFSPKEIPPGIHKVQVKAGDEDFGITTIDVQSDVDKFVRMLHKSVQTDGIILLATLLRTHSGRKEDVEGDLVDILSEKPFNSAFLNLLEAILRLEPKYEENSGNEDFGESLYPSLLHFCASYGLASACEWLLHNTEDKRSWKNRDGQTPVELAEHTNYVHLKELLDPDKDISPPLGPRENLSLDLESEDDDNVFLSSPISSETTIKPLSSQYLDLPLRQQRSQSWSVFLRNGPLTGMRCASDPVRFSGMRCASDPVRDSGRFSSEGSRGGSAASITMPRLLSANDIPDGIPLIKHERPYDEIEEDKSPDDRNSDSTSSETERYSFKKKHHIYAEPEDHVPGNEIEKQYPPGRGLNTISEASEIWQRKSERPRFKVANTAATDTVPKSAVQEKKPLLRHTSTRNTRL